MKPAALETANGISWRIRRNVCRSDHQMLVNDVASDLWILAQPHPTALRPYCVVLPGGEILDRKFAHLVDAKAAAIAAQLADYE